MQVESWTIWTEMDLYEHIVGLDKYMIVDESMDSYIGSKSGSETKEHYHNG